MHTGESGVTRSIEMNSMGLALSNLNKNQIALKYFDRALEADQTFFEPQYNKVKALLLDKKIKEAMEFLDSIIDQDDKQKFAYYLKANILFFHYKQAGQAIELYNKAIFLGENNENIYFNIGLCFHKCGQMDQALQWIERAERINGKRIDILLIKGELQTAVARNREAVETYDKVLVQQADNIRAFHFKALNLAQLKNNEEALCVLDIAEGITGSNQIFNFDRALIYENMKDFEKAIFYIDKVLDPNKKNAIALLKKASLLTICHEYDRAKQIFGTISEVDPENYEGLFSKASIHMLLKEYKEANEIFDFILDNSKENNPFSIYSYYFKALTLKYLGDEAGAAVAYQTALVFYSTMALRYSQDVKLMELKANTLRDMKKCLEADEIYQYIIELNDSLGNVHIMRAKNYLYMSKIDEAKQELQLAISINASFKEVIKLDDELKTYIES